MSDNEPNRAWVFDEAQNMTPEQIGFAVDYASKRSGKGMTVIEIDHARGGIILGTSRTCTGSRGAPYATGAMGPAAFECSYCGAVWALEQLERGRLPFHFRRGDEVLDHIKRHLRRIKRKDRAARKRRRGW